MPWHSKKKAGDLVHEVPGTDDMKGYILLTDCRTAVKSSHTKTLMSKELRVQLVYVARSDDGSGDNIHKLTVWYWPKSKQATAALIITWADPPCPFDASHNWSVVNGDTLYNGGFAQYAILKETDLFKPSYWIRSLPVAVDNAAATIPSVESMEEVDADDLSFMVDNHETYVILKRPTGKDGEFREIKRKIMTCEFMNMEGMYRIVSDRSLSESVYEFYIKMRVNPSGGEDMKIIMDATQIDDNELSNYKVIMFPIFLRQSDTKSITHLSEKMGSFWPPLGNVFTRHFSLLYFRDLLANKTQVFLSHKKILRAIDNFGFQYGTPHKLSAGLFCFANCVIDASTARILTHGEAGYKLMDEIFAESQLSPNFYPWICPVEDRLVRLRFFRTLIHLAKKFTGVNFQAFMVTLSSYFCAPKFEFIQREMFGVFIKVLTSSEGSTGKTEMIKMLNAMFGMNTKAMCASATDAGLYEILGKIFSCIPICVDDLKTGGEKGNRLDETIKSLYDAMVRVVYKKMRSSRCQLMVTTNTVFCPNDQPVQSRLLLQTIRKMPSFDTSLLTGWRKMQSIASMLCVDILGFPINPVHVQDCIDYMTCILANKCVGTRSSQNWGLALYYRILIQRLIPCEDEEWDDLFGYVAKEICRITIEYSSDAGIIDKFSNCFRMMQKRNNGLDQEGYCFGLHNLRQLTEDEKQNLELDTSLQYYAFDLDDIIDVMTRRLSVKREDLNVKGLRLMFMGQLQSEGVSQQYVKFYDKTMMLQYQKSSERPMTESEFQMIDEENKRPVYCFVVPQLILDLTANTTDQNVVDFRNIRIGWEKRNLYKEITQDTWKGFEDLRKHPLYQVADEHGLWQADDWSDPEYEKRQFIMIDNMINLYRPEGKIVWPREDLKVDWEGDFYYGHSSVDQNAKENRANFERQQTEEATAKTKAIERAKDYQMGDEDEEGHSRGETDSMISDDMLEKDADPWKAWVRAEHGRPPCDPKQCPACRTVYTTDMCKDKLLCGTCYRTESQKYKAEIDTVDAYIDHEKSKRQKLGGEVEEAGEESEEDENYVDGNGSGNGSQDEGSEDIGEESEGEKSEDEEDEEIISIFDGEDGNVPGLIDDNVEEVQGEMPEDGASDLWSQSGEGE